MGGKGKWDGEEMNLYNHQRDGIDFIIRNGGSGALFWEMGLGKTRAALEIYKHYRLHQPELRLFVICPISLIEGAWGEDIRKFSSLTYCNAHDEPLPLILKEDILLINYEAITLKRNAGIINLMRDNMVVLDESSKCKNAQTKITKALLSMRNLPKFKLIMSGTPAPNSPMEYYAQMEWLRPGILHKSFYGFRNTYFHLQRGGQIMNGSVVTRRALFDAMRTGFKYVITPQNLKRMMVKIDPLISRARKEDCLDLPSKVDEIRQVTLSAQQMKHYREMKNCLITEIRGQQIVAQVILAKILKLQEIVSGFCFDSSGNILEIKDGDSKYNELLKTLDEIGDKQVIVWCRFKYEIQRLLKLLPNSCSLYSETKDREDSINGFKQGKYKYFIANTHSGGHGLTLINCSYMIYFSIDYSWEGMAQSRDRNHRIGQTEKCTYIYLIGKDTIEEDIFKIVKEKGKINKLIENLLK